MTVFALALQLYDLISTRYHLLHLERQVRRYAAAPIKLQNILSHLEVIRAELARKEQQAPV